MRDREVQQQIAVSPYRPVTPQVASKIRRLIQIASESYSGNPISRLVKTCVHLTNTPLKIDLAAAKLIGVPVVVLRDESPLVGQPVFEKLSAREREVARLIAAGFGNAKIAHELGISIGTIKDHVHHALKKTGLKSRTELAAALAREGV